MSPRDISHAHQPLPAPIPGMVWCDRLHNAAVTHQLQGDAVKTLNHLAGGRRRTTFTVVAAVGCLTLVSACGSGTQPADGSGNGGSSKENKTIAFSALSLSIPAMKSLSEGVQGYSKSKGYSVVVQDPNFDPQKQAQDLASVIESGRVGGAWVIALQPSSLAAVVKSAQAKKIPLLLNGTPEEYGLSGMQPGVTFDAIDYTAKGKAIGETLGKCINDKLDGKGKIIMTVDAPGTAGKAEVEKAELAALKATASDAEIVSTVVVKDRQGAQTDVGNALQGHDDANALLGTNDEAALGGLGAFEAAGKEVPCLVETGGNDEALGLVKDGKMYASVALQFQDDMVQSFETLTKLMKDPTATGEQLTVPQKVITAGS
jgi:ribose transport system substrate-binding protein